MDPQPSDITPYQAAEMLDWLIAMGADEIISETPVRRLDTQKAAADAPAPAAKVAAAVPERPKQVVQPAQSGGSSDASEVAKAALTLDALEAAFNAFDGCALRKSATHTCFVGGNLQSPILVLADKPRTEEDKDGRVFAGKNELLIENMLKAIRLSATGESGRTQVMLANLIPWRPPGNRSATDIEVKSCLPFAMRAIELARPKVILALGGLPGNALASGDPSIARQRGKWMALTIGRSAIPMLSTFHPDDLIKTQTLKRLAWRDLLMLREKLDELGL
jgi:uracil-DNA glycosylase